MAAGSEAPCRGLHCIHVGPYDEVAAAHQATAPFCEERGLQYAGPPMEFYLNDPQETPPAELRTRVETPVR